MVDIFQGEYYLRRAPTATTLMLDAAWKWLPKTAIFVNAQQGYIFYLNQAQAAPATRTHRFRCWSPPGLRGLLTEKTSADRSRSVT